MKDSVDEVRRQRGRGWLSSLLGAMPKKAGILGFGKKALKDFRVRTNVAGFVSSSGISCPCLASLDCTRLQQRSTEIFTRCVSVTVVPLYFPAVPRGFTFQSFQPVWMPAQFLSTFIFFIF